MQIPPEVKKILETLRAAGFEAYVVGGCVRDLLLGKKPKDWDVCTNALPEKIQELFPDNFYANKFGTVTVKQKSKDETLREIEVTTYRVDIGYSDKRHPDEVCFTPNLKEDLARRDFTVNAMAMDINGQITDPFDGQKDLEKKVIKTVGNPLERFDEDALRMLRAVRFAVTLNDVKPVSPKTVEQVPQTRVKPVPQWEIEAETEEAIKKNAGWLDAISKERIRDEFEKIIMAQHPEEGILMLHEFELLEHIIPELEKGVNVGQNKHHIYTIFEHNLYSLKFAAQKKYNLVVRLAALLHDIGKVEAKRGEGPDSTFYNHDMIGAKAAARILKRLRFSREIIERVSTLIRNHMFVYDVGLVTEAAVRRLLVRVGKENIKDLIALRVADRLGSGVPKAQPYRLRHFQYMVEKVQHDPISAKMLKINGNDLMLLLNEKPGPKIGAILDVLLAEVIEEPNKNTKEFLSGRAKELEAMDLTQLRKLSKEKIEEKKEEEDQNIKNRYWVK